MIKILSIDGGGIRGLIPLFLLNEIEKRTNKKINELFNLMGGISSGGLICLLVSKPNKENSVCYSIEQIIEISKKTNRQIFKTYFGNKLWHFLTKKYSDKSFENLLLRQFGDLQLKDCLNNLVLPSFDMYNKTPFFFKSHRAKENENYNYNLIDVAKAITAAPSYFSSKIIYKNKTIFNLVDGCLFTNNPTACLYAEVCRIYKKQECFVLSLGTGQPNVKKIKKKIKWGIFQWAYPLINNLMESDGNVVDYQMKYFLNNDYIRLQPIIPENLYILDDTNNKTIQELENVGRRYIENNQELIDKICQKLLI